MVENKLDLTGLNLGDLDRKNIHNSKLKRQKVSKKKNKKQLERKKNLKFLEKKNYSQWLKDVKLIEKKLLKNQNKINR